MKKVIAIGLFLNAALLVSMTSGVRVIVQGAGSDDASLCSSSNGDVNGDGRRDISDPLYMLNWLFGDGSEPPPVALCQQGDRILTPEQAEILSYMKIVELPIDAEGNTATTIRFNGVNVQITNGLGSTNGDPDFANVVVNGLGNLIVGYNDVDEDFFPPRAGSHNIVVGPFHSYTSCGGLVAGKTNSVTGKFASVSGGSQNRAAAETASVSGGRGNSALGVGAVILGGQINTAEGERSSISGGFKNTAAGPNSSVCGGEGNTAAGSSCTAVGGYDVFVRDDHRSGTGVLQIAP